MIQQAAIPCSTVAGNEETVDENLTTAATPCPEICEQTQNSGECSTGDQIFLNTFLSSASKIQKYSKLKHRTQRLAYLRALAINSLIKDAVKIFSENENEILNGNLDIIMNYITIFF